MFAPRTNVFFLKGWKESKQEKGCLLRTRHLVAKDCEVETSRDVNIGEKALNLGLASQKCVNISGSPNGKKKPWRLKRSNKGSNILALQTDVDDRNKKYRRR